MRYHYYPDPWIDREGGLGENRQPGFAATRGVPARKTDARVAGAKNKTRKAQPW